MARHTCNKMHEPIVFGDGRSEGVFMEGALGDDQKTVQRAVGHVWLFLKDKLLVAKNFCQTLQPSFYIFECGIVRHASVGGALLNLFNPDPSGKAAPQDPRQPEFDLLDLVFLPLVHCKTRVHH